ncbi:MAG TPA: ORF6N domain-containing protein [Burkholderiales bacterium]|nr:ORF6N domain-containing protein [Burkholderiales bacterium]
MAAHGKALTTASKIAESILLVRGHKVLLDSTLASLYGVQTKVLVQAVKRNRERFPADFMFELNNQDVVGLRSQSVTSSWGGRRYLPFAFTEQGVAMLSSVLNSPQAIRVNIEIMRAFVRLREMIATNKELSGKLDELERKVATHDQAIAGLISAIRELATPISPKPKRRIGFVSDQ